jgi:hypothetical protein
MRLIERERLGAHVNQQRQETHTGVLIMNTHNGNTKRIRVSHGRLRRLSRRFTRIYAVHKDRSPEIHALGRASLPTVERFESTFDELTIRRNALKIETQQGRSAVE